MNTKTYLTISGFVFFLVGLLHLFRLFRHWPVQVGAWIVPFWFSFLGLVAAWGLCAWAFRLRRG